MGVQGCDMVRGPQAQGLFHIRGHPPKVCILTGFSMLNRNCCSLSAEPSCTLISVVTQPLSPCNRCSLTEVDSLSRLFPGSFLKQVIFLSEENCNCCLWARQDLSLTFLLAYFSSSFPYHSRFDEVNEFHEHLYVN